MTSTYTPTSSYVFPSTVIPDAMLVREPKRKIPDVRLNISVYAKMQYLATAISKPLFAVGTFRDGPSVLVESLIIPRQTFNDEVLLSVPLPEPKEIKDIKRFNPNTINVLICKNCPPASLPTGHWIVVSGTNLIYESPYATYEATISGESYNNRMWRLDRPPFNVRVAWRVPFRGQNPDAWSIEYNDAIHAYDTDTPPVNTPVGGPLTADERAEYKWLASQESRESWQRYVT